MKKYTLLIILMVAGMGIMAVFFGSNIVKMSIPIQDYDIFVDPIIDKQNLFDIGRVTIQNTGLKPITNIHVNFGDGDTLDLKILEPGDKILLSPPSENSMEYVMVSADNEIFVSKAYRAPPKMVGMMGS
ncbi:MAG TPA: hypothetical protein VMW55_08265 [Nitrosopumilaceae archaeon]|nr:hypothetical protein [Nitrosopumilaceae archaeon]